jgi:hypothetical protein
MEEIRVRASALWETSQRAAVLFERGVALPEPKRHDVVAVIDGILIIHAPNDTPEQAAQGREALDALLRRHGV